MLRYGSCTVVASALGVIVLGLAVATQMTMLWELWLTWGLMIGLATGVTANVLGATVANRWFAQRRGLVIGLLSASSATGQLLFLPLAAWLADHVGWRLAMAPAGLLCLLCLVLVIVVVRDHPGELALPSYGETEVVPPPSRRAGGNALTLSFAALALASRNRGFWILFGTFFVCGLSTNGLVQNHFIPLCHDFGMDAVAAASVLAVMGAFDFVGTIGSGWLSDRFDNRWLLCWYYGLRGLSLLMLPYTDFSFYGLSLFAVFYGLDWIATVPPTVRLTAQTFGRVQAPLVFGWIFTAHQLGAADRGVRCRNLARCAGQLSSGLRCGRCGLPRGCTGGHRHAPRLRRGPCCGGGGMIPTGDRLNGHATRPGGIGPLFAAQSRWNPAKDLAQGEALAGATFKRLPRLTVRDVARMRSV